MSHGLFLSVPQGGFMSTAYLVVPPFLAGVLTPGPLAFWLDILPLPFNGFADVIRSDARLLLTSFMVLVPIFPLVPLICGAPFLQVPRMILIF